MTVEDRGTGSEPAGPSDLTAQRSEASGSGRAHAGVSASSIPGTKGGSVRDLERYADLFSSRTRVMKSSAMRDLMALTERPEVISLAGGLPDTTLFPAEDLAKILSHTAANSAAKALQYAPTEGVADVQPCLAEVMAAEGMHVDPSEILVTTGGQQVIDLTCKTLVDPGDVVIAEAPTYPGAVPTFSAYQTDLVQIAMDTEGMRMDLLEETLVRLIKEGRKPKFIYTIPTFQNPGGVTMSLARRKRLVELAHEHEILILEDNPYGLLRFEGEPLPTLYELDGGKFVIYAGTLSKVISPGIRVGWALAPGPIRQKMVIGKQGSDLNSSALSQYFVATYFAERDWRDHVAKQTEVYRHRRDVMLESLAQHMPEGTEWTKPEGGMFVWAKLPEMLDTTDLLAVALQRDVAFVPGRAAYLDGRGGREMRLNFSGSTPELIREGIARIGAVVADQLELYESLTGEHRIISSGDEKPAPQQQSEGAPIVPLRTAGRRLPGSR